MKIVISKETQLKGHEPYIDIWSPILTTTSNIVDEPLNFENLSFILEWFSQDAFSVVVLSCVHFFYSVIKT